MCVHRRTVASQALASPRAGGHCSVSMRGYLDVADLVDLPLTTLDPAQVLRLVMDASVAVHFGIVVGQEHGDEVKVARLCSRHPLLLQVGDCYLSTAIRFLALLPLNSQRGQKKGETHQCSFHTVLLFLSRLTCETEGNHRIAQAGVTTFLTPYAGSPA